ncbi:MAG: hypothetical protein ABI682_04025 [Acidobacteriota bacterium]
MRGLKGILTAATFLALVACSERTPTAPEASLEKNLTSQGAATVGDRVRRPTPRVVGSRGGGTRLPLGVWGGERAEISVTEKGATVKFFCAHGMADQPILYDADGRFSVVGWFVREGGPLPIDETVLRRPALYTGKTDGKTLTLTVFVDNTSLGPFTLILGRKSNLGPCPIL